MFHLKLLKSIGASVFASEYSSIQPLEFCAYMYAEDMNVSVK